MKRIVVISFCLCMLMVGQAQVTKSNNFLFSGLAQIKSVPIFHGTRVVKQHIISSSTVSKMINVSVPGTLSTLLTSIEKNSITNLTLTGNIDARDFRIMRDSMPVLSVLDISGVSIVAYSGSEGTGYSSSYPANEIPEYAFYVTGEAPGTYISELTSIILPLTTTSVGLMAFTFCSSLTSVFISASVTQIGQLAFVGCGATINVDPANPNYSSDNGVLYDKAKMTLIQCPLSFAGNYDIPTTVKSIAMYGFCFCDRLTSVNIPSTVESIEMYAFTSCSGLINVDNNNPNYTSLEGVLFNKSVSTLIQCSTSKSGSYSIPSSVDTISNNAFYNCTLMTSVSIPSSINAIADLAFFNCSGLTSITVNSLPVSLDSSYNVFQGVNQSTCILNVPYGTKSIYQSFKGWNAFIQIVENTHGFVLGTNKLILSSVAGSNASVKISTNDAWTVSSNQSWLKVSPESGSGSDTIVVTAEANLTSESRMAVVTVTADGIQHQTIQVLQSGIPKTLNLTPGGLLASMTASELSSAINLKISGTIDARDFKTMRDNMPKLAFLDISEASIAAYSGALGTASWITVYAANRIPDYSFNVGASSQQFTLTTVKLPATITAVGDYAFYSCESLTEIIIPNSVTYIGQGGFGSCNSLVNVTLPNNLTCIENSAFISCPISTISIPNTVKTIGQYGFGFCKKLQSINIPNSVTTIINSAFESCTALTDLTIGNSVTYIGNSAFSGCSSLTTVAIPNSVTTMDGFAFAHCANLKSVSLPNSLPTIGYYCFYQCAKLTDISIPNSVTKIDYSAFSYCNSLNTITIPGSVTIIGYSAFSYCTGLKSITVNTDIPIDLSSSNGVFTGVDNNNCFLNVPFGTKTIYSTANQWKDFVNIVENPSGFTLETNNIKLGYNDGSNATVKVTSNNQWIVSSDQSWLKVTPAIGMANGLITLIAEANPSLLTRTATVTVSATGVTSKTINVVQLAAPKVVTISAGGLATALTATELSTVSNLVIVGTIDARDFKTLRDNMPKLAYLDISAINVVAYTGTAGTIGTYTNTYLANQIPQNALSTTYAGKLSLISVVLPTSVNSIGNFAFQFCGGLTTIIIPESVTSIGYYAFASCSSLNNITLPSSIKRIESYTFSKCSKLTNIKIPELVTTISFDAFESCTSLTDIVIPNSVTLIDMNAFQYCSSFKEITIPNSVTTIGSNAFASCSNLTNVTLSNSITGIASYTFANCMELVTINIPNNVKTIDTEAFQNCYKLETINFGSAVQTLNYGVFLSCSALKHIIIPNTVTLIGNSVFMNCTALIDITIPNSVTSIGSDAFNGCTALKEISIPNSVTKLSLQTFANCSGLKKVTLGDSLTSIETGAFYYCTSLDSIVLPALLTTIGGSVFNYCTTLKNVSLGNSLNSIGNGGFANCYALNSITLPLSLITIGSSAFQSCSSLTEIIIPNSVTTLGDDIFRNCDKLTKVVNSNSVKNIPSMSFSGCTKLSDISIGSSVVSIGELAFDYCVSLDNLTLPASLQIINGYAFRFCSTIDSISIPGSVTSIGVSAFESCTGLKAIYANRLSPIDISNNVNVFKDVDNINCILHVPYSTKLLYGAANQWKDFVNIVENQYGLMLDTDSANVSVNTGSSVSVKVMSNTTWTATSDQSWLNVSYNSGIGNNTITLTAEANSSFSTRKAIVTVKATDVEPRYVIITQDAITKNVSITAGGLSSALTHNEHTLLNRLSISGTLDATDFKFMRDSIPNLTYLDIRQTNITAYTGTNGTGGPYYIIYPAGTIPQYAFYNNYNAIQNKVLKSILLPNTISSIGNAAFEYCSKLDSIVIPNSVTSLIDNSFSNCSGLKNVTFGSSLTSIGSYAFYNCSNLTSLYALLTSPVNLSSPSYVFYNVNKTTCILYVPTGSKTLYQAAAQWKDFTNIIEMTTAVPTLLDSKISIYPNPIRESFSINGLTEPARVNLTDLSGKQFVNRQVEVGETLQIGDLPKGIYIIRVITSEGTMERKMIKE